MGHNTKFEILYVVAIFSPIIFLIVFVWVLGCKAGQCPFSNFEQRKNIQCEEQVNLPYTQVFTRCLETWQKYNK